jgi:hypothetical protein
VDSETTGAAVEEVVSPCQIAPFDVRESGPHEAFQKAHFPHGDVLGYDGVQAYCVIALVEEVVRIGGYYEFDGINVPSPSCND